MIKKAVVITCFCLMIALCSCIRTANSEASDAGGGSGIPAYTDVVILTTTDMHGKCWSTNILTESKETSSMLRVSTAAHKFREEYGEENVLLIDNGDIFQGTPVSEICLKGSSEDGLEMPPAMAVCLKEIGYDALELGNHEFDFSWEIMQEVYQYLEENKVAVLAANICYDGTDGRHEEGGNAFTPYLIKTVSVNGNEHKIGILGLDNPDTKRLESPGKYPGLLFSHPENTNDSIAYEAGLYIPKMIEEGCEFIITAYHGGLGHSDGELIIGRNTEHQGQRLLEANEDIDMLILGHDHTSGYSNTTVKDRKGREVPIVNAGGRELTETVFRFSETESGSLKWELIESTNLNLGDYEIDSVLESQIAPYAEMAEKAVRVPLGTVTGNWDESDNYFREQTDTMDLVCAAQMVVPSKQIAARYGEGPIECRDGARIDHTDVDMTIAGVAVSNNYVVRPGKISQKDIWQLYRYPNRLAVIPMYGYEIRNVMEENAAERLTVRVYNGEAHIFTKNEIYTNLIIGGLNFTCDMSRPEGERIRISGFANGRPFKENGLYLVSASEYLIGNDRCGLREFSAGDAVWSQSENNNDGTVPDIIVRYIENQCRENGSLTPDAFTWNWSLEYSKDPGALPPFTGEAAASLRELPKDGHSYVIYSEPEGKLLAVNEKDEGLASAECEAYGNILPAPLPEGTLVFTAHAAGADKWTFTDPDGRYLSCKAGGDLLLTENESENERSCWMLEPAYGGWNIISAGGGSDEQKDRLALELYNGRFSTYVFQGWDYLIFNFYECWVRAQVN